MPIPFLHCPSCGALMAAKILGSEAVFMCPEDGFAEAHKPSALTPARCVPCDDDAPPVQVRGSRAHHRDGAE